MSLWVGVMLLHAASAAVAVLISLVTNKVASGEHSVSD